MKRAIFAFVAVVVISSSSGCCLLDRLFCWGCDGAGGYGHGCGACGSSCGGCGGGCGGGCSSGGCGSGGCGGGGCSDCGSYAGNTATGGGRAMVQNGPGGMNSANVQYGPGASSRMIAAQRAGQNGHPLVRQRRDSGEEYEFAAGPPTGATTYPYYTNRGPRDFLARNPRDIGN